MAIRKQTYGDENTKIYKMPEFSKTSKMNLYDMFFDTENENKPRAGFLKDISFSDDQKKTMTVFTVTTEYEHRIDAISFKFYGTTTRDWLIEAANDIVDPIKDIVAGVKLLIPSDVEIYNFMG